MSLIFVYIITLQFCRTLDAFILIYGKGISNIFLADPNTNADLVCAFYTCLTSFLIGAVVKLFLCEYLYEFEL